MKVPKWKHELVGLMASVLVLSGCGGARERDSARVQLQFPADWKAQQSLALALGQYQCFGVSVVADDLTEWDPSGLGLGVTSAPFSTEQTEVELLVPQGVERKIRLVGVKLPTGDCPEAFTLADGFVSLINNATLSCSEIQADVLGQTTADLLQPEVEVNLRVTVGAGQEAASAIDCSTSWLPLQLSGLLAWFEPEGVSSSTEEWFDATGHMNLVNLDATPIQTSLLAGWNVFDFNGGTIGLTPQPSPSDLPSPVRDLLFSSNPYTVGWVARLQASPSSTQFFSVFGARDVLVPSTAGGTGPLFGYLYDLGTTSYYLKGLTGDQSLGSDLHIKSTNPVTVGGIDAVLVEVDGSQGAVLDRIRLWRNGGELPRVTVLVGGGPTAAGRYSGAPAAYLSHALGVGLSFQGAGVVGSFTFEGQIAEGLLVAGTLTENEKAQLFCYWSKKYALALSGCD